MINRLTSVIIAASMTIIGLSTSANAAAAYPIVPSSDASKLVCYMQTADGRTLNLRELCGNSVAENIRRLLATKQCQKCDLSGANLGSADLPNADLRGANLAGADLRSANLVGANLDGADLSGASLSGAILSGTNLQGTTMPDGTNPMLPKR